MVDREDRSATPRIQIEPSSPRDEWSNVRDPNERRKIQNRIAQRKFREKARQQRRLDARIEENERYAGAAYTPPDPRELDAFAVSGPPWGSISLKHIVETGREKQQKTTNQFGVQPLARNNAASTSVGLHLADQYARGVPAWSSWRVSRPVIEYSGSIDTDSSMISDR